MIIEGATVRTSTAAHGRAPVCEGRSGLGVHALCVAHGGAAHVPPPCGERRMAQSRGQRLVQVRSVTAAGRKDRQPVPVTVGRLTVQAALSCSQPEHEFMSYVWVGYSPTQTRYSTQPDSGRLMLMSRRDPFPYWFQSLSCVPLLSDR